jgi:hypothetical protein
MIQAAFTMKNRYYVKSPGFLTSVCLFYSNDINLLTNTRKQYINVF